MLAEDVGGALPGEGGGVAETGGDLRDCPPIGAGFARDGEEGALAADHPFAVGDGAFLFAPGLGGQADMGEADAVGVGDAFRDGEEVAFLHRGADRAAIGH